jgi:hypothetical protein
MAVKYKNLYLYLALACFLGIILIFIFDGYMGIHDTLFVTAREYPQKIEADQWAQAKNGYIPTVNVEWGGKAAFRYEIDNHWFSSYGADVGVSVWQNQVKVADVLSKTITVKAFGKGQLDWVLDTGEFVSVNLSTGMTSDFTVVIKRGDIERKVIVYVYTDANQPKLIPIVPPGGLP